MPSAKTTAGRPAADKATNSNYALTVADQSYDWYRRRAIITRRAHRFSEFTNLLVAAAIPVSAVALRGNALVPAGLGAVVVVASGLRSLFRWQENHLRFSGAREAVKAQLRLYHIRAAPYDDAATRDQRLVSAVSAIEQQELGMWQQMASTKPSQ